WPAAGYVYVPTRELVRTFPSASYESVWLYALVSALVADVKRCISSYTYDQPSPPNALVRCVTLPSASRVYVRFWIVVPPFAVVMPLTQPRVALYVTFVVVPFALERCVTRPAAS